MPVYYRHMFSNAAKAKLKSAVDLIVGLIQKLKTPNDIFLITYKFKENKACLFSFYIKNEYIFIGV